MAVFSSSGGQEQAAASGRGGREGSLTIVAVGTVVVGELQSEGVVKVEGRVEGAVRAQRQVLIAKEGVIKGDIFTREAIVGGQVLGSVLADERVEIQADSSVQGDITTQRLTVHEGGEVNGTVKMANPKALDRKPRVVSDAAAAPKALADTGSR